MRHNDHGFRPVLVGAVVCVVAGLLAAPAASAHQPSKSLSDLSSRTAAAFRVSHPVSRFGSVPATAVPAAGAFRLVAPSRVLDTRSGLGAPKTPVAAGGSIAVQVDGKAGIPATGVSAVVVTVTVTAPTAAGFITAYADGAGRPTASNLDFTATQTIPDLAVVPIGGDGKIRLYNGSAGTTQLIADIAGYYLAGDSTPPGAITGLTATPAPTSVTLTWTNPASTDLAGVTVRRTVGAVPPASPTAGNLVADTASNATSFTDTGLARGTQYSYALFAHDAAPNYAAAVTATIFTTSGPVITAITAPLPPDAGTTAGAVLLSASCPTAASCVAVGDYNDSAGNGPALIESLANGVWTATRAPLPADVPTSNPSAGLFSVACEAAGFCFAVGGYSGSGGQNPRAVIETQAGGMWTASHAPLPGDANTATPNASLSWISCPAVNFCAAAGTYTDFDGNDDILFEKFVNGSWTASKGSFPADAASPSTGGLQSMACSAANSCAAVGYYRDNVGNYPALVETLTAGGWTPTRAPLPPDNNANANADLVTVSCGAAASCTASGSYRDSAGNFQGLIDTLANGSWTATRAPLPSDVPSTSYASIYQMSCATADSCTAFGIYHDSAATSQGVIETLMNGAWTAAHPTLLADAGTPSYLQLNAGMCSTADTCTLVGSYRDSTSHNHGLIQTLFHGVWTATRAPLPPDAHSTAVANLNSVACAAAGYCTIVGTYGDLTDGYKALIETSTN